MSFTRDDFENMVRNFDPANCGSIDYREFATSCVLLNSPLPTPEDVGDIARALQEPEVSKDAFHAAACWFDATESSQDRDYSHPFSRAQLIKSILFSLHAGDSATLPVPAFTECLLLGSLRQGKSGLIHYGDILCYKGPSQW